MNHGDESGGSKHSCKSAKEKLVQIGEPAAPAYWKSIEDLRSGPRFTGEFPGGLPPILSDLPAKTETTRRDFLTLMGFSLAVAGLSGCRAPVQSAIPLLVGSDQIIPGVSSWYATTCRGCASSCSLLVKQREGGRSRLKATLNQLCSAVELALLARQVFSHSMTMRACAGHSGMGRR